MNRHLSYVRKMAKIRNRLDKRESLCILMQYETEMMYKFGKMTF